MKETYLSLASSDKKLTLSVFVSIPKKMKAVVQFSHGMSEHKERYIPFIHYLNAHGYGCVIHDHRGHGGSVKSTNDYGYFDDKTYTGIIEDLYQVTKYIKDTYPSVPIYLFAHSMGTLVARNYLKKYDYLIEKLVLCGPPYENALAKVGFHLASLQAKFMGDRHRSNIIHNLSVGGFDKKFKGHKRNRWISHNIENVEQYNQHNKCGFIFTLNGFQNLFHLMHTCFHKDTYVVANPNLGIFFIAGENDPVIGKERQFLAQVDFMKQLGYKRVTYKKYPHMRHEILHEKDKMKVYQDILTFFYY